jgi:hypothetical protein
VIADALTRHWWPLSALAAIALPKTRLPLAAALLADPRKLPDDLAYGLGLWRGCLTQRTLDPLLPARAWLNRRVYYGRTAAAISRRHPGQARPLNVSPWTTAAWLALAARRPVTALGIVGVATALTAREVDPATAFRLAAVGSFRSGRVVADALTRAWWPLAAAAAVHPAARLPLAAALATKRPLQLADDLAYGLGLWQGCLEQRTIDPLLPARPWKLDRVSLS